MAEDGHRVFTANVSGKIGKVTRAFALRIAQGAVESDDFSGCLYQNPWGRKDVAAPKIAKTFKTEYGNYVVKVKKGGKVLMSGKQDGVSVSGTFQLVSTSLSNLGDTYLLPVVLPAKRSFEGFAEVLSVKLAVNASNAVDGIVSVAGGGTGRE